jgi:hypothetical protein
MPKSSNAALFWPVAGVIVVADVITKWVAVSALSPVYTSREVFGDWFKFTLVYNRGAAFGLHVGPYSRWVFLILTLVALYVLGRLYLTTRAGQRLRAFSIALVCGGALGGLHRHGRRRLAVAHLQHRRRCREHRCVPPRLGALGRRGGPIGRNGAERGRTGAHGYRELTHTRG